MGKKIGGLERNFYMRYISPFMGIRPWRRHSTILLVAGILYILIGVQYFISPMNPTRQSSLAVLLSVAPIEFWGTLFILAGVLAAVSSRWPPFSEVWGYMALTGISSAWSCAYSLGIIFFHSPAINISGSIIWGLLAFMWWAISGLVNPEAVVVKIDDGK